MDMAFLGELLTNVADRGRALIGFERFLGNRSRPIDKLCEDLLSGRGEASGMALAQAVLEAWQGLDKPGRLGEAQASRFARLRAESGKRGSNIYIQSELAALATYITKLKEAQAQKAALTGGAAPAAARTT